MQFVAEAIFVASHTLKSSYKFVKIDSSFKMVSV